ncbi:MAG: hypothetical protein HC932_03970 [Thermales bacterium]|nr:hypothetical protein [Thermales bacterium]
MRILQERKEALNIKSLSFINSQEIQEGLKGGDLDINFVKIQWEELRIIKMQILMIMKVVSILSLKMVMSPLTNSHFVKDTF